MNEDLRPCYDIESCWERVLDGHSTSNKIIYKHNDCPHLFRIIDYNKEVIYFKDLCYVTQAGIIDINRKLTTGEKSEVLGLILDIMHKIRPISMPYVPVSYKVYIEYHKKTLGILYFMDIDEDKSIVPIKRFFGIKHDPVLNFTEISWAKFREIAEEVEDGNVD